MRLEPATLRGNGNDRSRTSMKIDKRSRTSRMIPTASRRNAETRQPEFRVHRVERAWIQKDVEMLEMHEAQVHRRCLTK